MEEQTTNLDVLTAVSNRLADAVERISPALVLVNARPRLPGSGVVYDSNLVLTADHVIEREEDITTTTHDGRTLPAQFVGRDPASDLAVLRVDDLGLDPATPTATPPRVGQWVLAVGRPTEGGPMASSGIVSALGGPLRTRRGGVLEQYIRTDATPYPGFSGGALINTGGEVVGILTTGFGGIALAIPAGLAWSIGGTLARHGRIRRGYLGISSQPVHIPPPQRAGRAQERGLLIIRVEPGSPAERGGLLMGDILVSLDGQPVADADELQPLLSGDRVGKAVPVEVIRGGSLHTLQVTIGERQ
jgi:S1-C subfamily serine protease